MPRAERSPATGQRRKVRPADTRPLPQHPDIPPWLVAGEAWEKLPDEIRDPALRILPPAYRRFVLDVPNELERSIGAALVSLTWLELCGQVRLAHVLANSDALEALFDDPRELTARHLRLVKAKCRTVALWARMRAVGHAAGVQPVIAPAADHRPPATVDPTPATTVPNLENPQLYDQLDHPALTIHCRPRRFPVLTPARPAARIGVLPPAK